MQKIPAGAYNRPGSTANECMPTVVNVIAAIEDPQNNRPKPAVVTPDAVAVSDIHIKVPHINMIPKRSRCGRSGREDQEKIAPG